MEDHPKCYFANQRAMVEYMRLRRIEYHMRPGAVAVLFNGGRPSLSSIQIMWLEQARQVRFVVAAGTSEIPAGRMPAVLQKIDELNGIHGFGLWRTQPALAAQLVVFTNHDGTLSSTVFETALALLKKATVVDRPQLAAEIGGFQP